MTKACFVFPGNGVQETIYWDREVIDISENRTILDGINHYAGHDLVGLMLDKKGRKEIIAEKDIQLATVGAEIMLADRLKQNGVECESVVGLSLGELGAIAAAGCIEDKTALIYLASKRAEAMAKCVPTEYCVNPDEAAYMAAIANLNPKLIKSYCHKANKRTCPLTGDPKYGNVSISNYNTPSQTVISGSPGAVAKVIHTIKRKFVDAPEPKYQGVSFVLLKTKGPWHNEHYMGPANEEFAKVLEDFPIQPPKVPCYLTATQHEETDPRIIKMCLAGQIDHNVGFWNTLLHIFSRGNRRMINVGPGKVVDPFLKSVSAEIVNRDEFIGPKKKKDAT